MPSKQVDYGTIFRILRDSAYKRELASNDTVRSQWKQLRESFQGVTFVEQEFSFVDPRTGKKALISGLMRHPYFKPSDAGTPRFSEVQRHVNYLLNKKQFIEDITSESYIRDKVTLINDALENRELHRSESHSAFCEASDKLVGKYEIEGSDYYLVFSNDPVDIFMKSTGQAWERLSCERVGGQFEQGIYSDIEWCNLAIFLFHSDSPSAIGRVMLRTCQIAEKKKVSFGLEPIWYAVNGRIISPDMNVGDDYTVEDLEGIIRSIVEEKGFSMDYKICVTPYVYEGYSDNERAGRREISYAGPASIDAEDVISDSEPQVESTCPFCKTVLYWEIEWATDQRRQSAEAIKKAFNEINDEIVDNYYVHDVSVEQFDPDLYGINNGEAPAECPGPGCGARRFEREFGDDDRALIKAIFKIEKLAPGKNKAPKYFNDLDDKHKQTVVSYDEEVRDFVLKELESDNYDKLVKAIRKMELEDDFMRFFMAREDALVKREVSRYKNKTFRHQTKEPAIKITDFYTGGRIAEEGDDDELKDKYLVTIKMYETDVDELAREYAVKKFGETRGAGLLEQQMPKPSPKGYKRLEKFCR